MSGPETAYDCQQCGACCVNYFGTEGYIQLTREEAARLRRLGLPVVTAFGQLELGTRPHDGPGGAATVCVAFYGEVGGACACAIHPERPGACRRFQAGTEMCRCARQEAGLPV